MIYYYSSNEVWELAESGKMETNGCGAGWSAYIIPDRWFGLDFTMACHLHDCAYQLGKTNEDKIIADRVFYNNMLRAVKARPKYLQFIGRRLALRYYQAVDEFGGVAFWEGKNNPEEMRTSIIDTTKKGIKIVKTIKAVI